ncbi:SagB/ThcOx family dehydrogenase [Xenorhabdus bovienii]|uniref:SagB/ThcOx family dehydrogenase n=1 Tax=Xenorhabdus bovienii TaxID=40576 RepID=UPI0023B33B3A|nr:SagB/ThcOx family dehydrogenase [Xenorhabdus bovienii]MDE9463078.1 SagB/ThcOx family dehydrogenase [Xenorhabdus bovienii]
MSPTFFLKIVNGKLILWDYKNHNQFEITKEHLLRIIEISQGVEFSDSKIDRDIRESNIFDTFDAKRWGWDMLSYIFHLGTQAGLFSGQELSRHANFDGYVEYCDSIVEKIPNVHIEREGNIVSLPDVKNNTLFNVPLKQALLERYSCRNYNKTPLSIEQLSIALWYTFGTVHGSERNDLHEHGMMPVGYRRTSPSGGSMHPSEPYVVALNVDGLEAGVYHYRSRKHELTKISDALADGDLGGLLSGQSFADQLSYGVFIVSRFDKMWWKYPHSRAYRVALLDIGCLIQTFQLINTAIGIQSWPTGYFLDHEINKLLNLDTEIESSMFFLGAGYGSGSVSKEALESIDRFVAKNENLII